MLAKLASGYLIVSETSFNLMKPFILRLLNYEIYVCVCVCVVLFKIYTLFSFLQGRNSNNKHISY